MRRVAIAAMMIAWAWSSAAGASDWRLVEASSTEDVGWAAGWIDAESIKRSGQQVTFWMLLVFAKPHAGMDNMRWLVEADCSIRRFRQLQLTSYLGRKVKNTGGPTRLTYAAPDTNMEGMIMAACGDKAMDNQSIADPYHRTMEVFRRLDRSEHQNP